MAKMSEKNVKIFTTTMKELKSLLGRLKIGPQIRTYFEKFKSIEEAVYLTRDCNTDWNDLLEELLDEFKGHSKAESMIKVWDLVDYVKTFFREDLFDMYKEDKEFIKILNKAIKLVDEGKTKELEALRDKYYIIVGGNTRFCLYWYIFNILGIENPTEAENIPVYIAIINESVSSNRLKLTGMMDYTLDLILNFMADNKHSKNTPDDAIDKTNRYLGDFFTKYCAEVYNNNKGLMFNLQNIKSTGYTKAGGNIKGLVKSCIAVALQDSLTDPQLKKFKNLVSYREKNGDSASGAIKNASYVLATLLGDRIEEGHNKVKNLLDYAGLDYNLKVVNTKKLLSYLDFICSILNSTNAALTQGTLLKMIKLTDAFDVKKKLTSEDIAVFQAKVMDNVEQTLNLGHVKTQWHYDMADELKAMAKRHMGEEGNEFVKELLKEFFKR